MRSDRAVTLEEMELVTLLPKTPNFSDDMLEVLELLRQDLEALHSGKSCGFGLPGVPRATTFFQLWVGVKIVVNNKNLELAAKLDVVVGDLNGLAEILFTRAPQAEDVSRLY